MRRPETAAELVAAIGVIAALDSAPKDILDALNRVIEKTAPLDLGLVSEALVAIGHYAGEEL